MRLMIEYAKASPSMTSSRQIARLILSAERADVQPERHRKDVEFLSTLGKNARIFLDDRASESLPRLVVKNNGDRRVFSIKGKRKQEELRSFLKNRPSFEKKGNGSVYVQKVLVNGKTARSRNKKHFSIFACFQRIGELIRRIF